MRARNTQETMPGELHIQNSTTVKEAVAKEGKTDITKATPLETAPRQYVRILYRPQSIDTFIRIIEYSVPRLVAGHVSKRAYRTVAALPPPKRKVAVNGSRKNKDEEPEEQKESSGGDGGDDDKGNGDEDNGNGDEERSSVLKEYLKEWDAGFRKIQMGREREERVFRTREFLDGPDRIQPEVTWGYQLFAADKDIWRFSGPSGGIHRAEKVVCWLERAGQAGWIWDEAIRKWYRSEFDDPPETRLVINAMPIDIGSWPEGVVSAAFITAKWRFYGANGLEISSSDSV